MTVRQITSRDNPLVKQLKALATSSQARRKAGQTVLDGVHLCESYLQQSGAPLVCAVGEGHRHHPEVAPIVARCESLGTECIELPDPLYQAISQVEHGIGLLFTIETPRPIQPEVLQGNAVILDAVQDPGNLGSILRSAAAAGVRQVFCGEGTAFAWSPKVLRAGMGAHFSLKVFENVPLAALLAKSQVPVLATSSHATERLYDADLASGIAWLFGNEGQGVAQDLLGMATKTVAIPHLGDMESLNVAATAAICLFEQVRQTMLKG